MNELTPCPVCGKKAYVIHMISTYDRADFGYSAGCSAYKINDGVHDEPMVFNTYTKEEAIEAWERKCNNG